MLENIWSLQRKGGKHKKRRKTKNYFVDPYYTGPKLTPAPSTLALIGFIFQMFTVKLS